MKRYTRFVVLFVLVMALVVPTFAHAQDMPCYGLSASDCDLFYKTGTTSSEVTSAAISYNINAVGPDFELASSASGSFSFNAEAADPMTALSMALDGELSGSGSGESESASFSVRIIDGVVYVSDGTAWQFIALKDMLAAMGIPLDPSMLLGDMSTETDPMAEAMMSEFGAMMESHITLTRGADETIDGNTVAVFNMSIDLAGLFTDTSMTDSLGSIIGMAMAASGGAGVDAGVDMESLNQMMPMMTQLFGMLFADSELTITTKVGVDNGYPYGFGIDFAMTLDPMMMASLTGAPPDAEAEPIDILFSLSVDMTQHNGSFSYEAPADATPMDPSVFGTPGL